MVDNVTLYGITTLVAGVLGVCIRYAFKSKCNEVNLCCGLLNIKRDVESELRSEQQEIEAGHELSATSERL
jgi:hypothetical protein